APKRLIVYAMLLGSVGGAVWWSRRRSWWRTGLIAVAVLALFPALFAAGRSASLGLPPFIAAGQYRTVLAPGETVIVVGRVQGLDMLWQAETDFRFRVAGGYTGGTPPDFEGSEFVSRIFRGSLDPADLDAFHRFL